MSQADVAAEGLCELEEVALEDRIPDGVTVHVLDSGRQVGALGGVEGVVTAIPAGQDSLREDVRLAVRKIEQLILGRVASRVLRGEIGVPLPALEDPAVVEL